MFFLITEGPLGPPFSYLVLTHKINERNAKHAVGYLASLLLGGEEDEEAGRILQKLFVKRIHFRRWATLNHLA